MSVSPLLVSSFTGIYMLRLEMDILMLPGLNYLTGVNALHGLQVHSLPTTTEDSTSQPTHVNTSLRVKLRPAL